MKTDIVGHFYSWKTMWHEGVAKLVMYNIGYTSAYWRLISILGGFKCSGTLTKLLPT